MSDFYGYGKKPFNDRGNSHRFHPTKKGLGETTATREEIRERMVALILYGAKLLAGWKTRRVLN